MPLRPMIAYPDVADDPLVVALRTLLVAPTDVAAEQVARAVFELDVPPPVAVADLVLASCGPFARAASRRPVGGDRRAHVAATELDELGRIAFTDLTAVAGAAAVSVSTGATDGVSAWPPAARVLRSRLASDPHWGRFAGDLADFHGREGLGALAIRRVLRWHGGRLVGIDRPDPVGIEDLIGGEDRRDPLARSLGAFVRGGPAVDALLYGPPGTGKSTAARALADRFAADGLRLVQVDRHDLGSIRELFASVAGGPRCLVLLDDLVFDETDRTDRELRGVLEGDVAERPTNVVVWATSNRMRLLRETRTEREDDIESDLGRGERSALATRFGVRVAFPFLTVEEFAAIAAGLVERHLGRVPDDLAPRARRFAVDRGLTPRAARQFADLFAGDAL